MGRIGNVPPVTDAELRHLRQKYHSAYTAHQNCVQARNHAIMSGLPPSTEQLQREAAALRALADARSRQLAGWVELANGNGVYEPSHILTIEPTLKP